MDKSYSAAVIDLNELVIYRLFYGVNSWSYVDRTPEELVNAIEEYEAKRRKKR